MVFFFVLFGIVGMEAYRGSFSRRCVWADTGQMKIPQQYCKRYDESDLLKFGIVDQGFNSNCGFMQLCLDVGAPNYGFTHFDNMAGELLSRSCIVCLPACASAQLPDSKSGIIEVWNTTLVIFLPLASTFFV